MLLYLQILPLDVITYHNLFIESKKKDYVMELYWDYDYYQSWTDNEWMVEKMLAIQSKENKGDEIDNI